MADPEMRRRVAELEARLCDPESEIHIDGLLVSNISRFHFY